MPARRTLLYLARDFPIPVSSAARLRTFNWVLHLSRRFDITFVAYAEERPDASHLEALQPYCTRLEVPDLRAPSLAARVWWKLHAEARYLAAGMPPESWPMQHGPLHATLQRLQREQRFDVVFTERWTWGAPVLRGAPVSVLDAGVLQAPRHAEALRRTSNPWRRLLRVRLADRYARAEAEVLQRAGLVLARNSAERRAIDATSEPGHAAVLPPGLDTVYFAPRRGALDPSNIVFFASLDSPAQRDALQHLQRDLMPRIRMRVRNAHITVVAPRLVPELEAMLQSDSSLRFAGLVDDPRRELWRAAVAAVPLRFGSGSPGHLAQLLAMGVPVVATPAAARGLDVVSGDGLIVAPDGADFSDALAQVMLDSSLREDLSRKGRETATARLSMAATYDRVSDLLAAETLHI